MSVERVYDLLKKSVESRASWTSFSSSFLAQKNRKLLKCSRKNLEHWHLFFKKKKRFLFNINCKPKTFLCSEKMNKNWNSICAKNRLLSCVQDFGNYIFAAIWRFLKIGLGHKQVIDFSRVHWIIFLEKYKFFYVSKKKMSEIIKCIFKSSIKW